MKRFWLTLLMILLMVLAVSFDKEISLPMVFIWAIVVIAIIFGCTDCKKEHRVFVIQAPDLGISLREFKVSHLKPNEISDDIFATMCAKRGFIYDLDKYNELLKSYSRYTDVDNYYIR